MSGQVGTVMLYLWQCEVAVATVNTPVGIQDTIIAQRVQNIYKSVLLSKNVH